MQRSSLLCRACCPLGRSVTGSIARASCLCAAGIVSFHPTARQALSSASAGEKIDKWRKVASYNRKGDSVVGTSVYLLIPALTVAFINYKLWHNPHMENRNENQFIFLLVLKWVLLWSLLCWLWMFCLHSVENPCISDKIPWWFLLELYIHQCNLTSLCATKIQ